VSVTAECDVEGVKEGVALRCGYRGALVKRRRGPVGGANK